MIQKFIQSYTNNRSRYLYKKLGCNTIAFRTEILTDKMDRNGLTSNKS